MEGLSGVGSVAAIIQLAGAFFKGLRTLRDAVRAVRDSPTIVAQLEEKVKRLEISFKSIDKHIRSRYMAISYESDLQEVIQNLTKSCSALLVALSSDLPNPSGPSRKIVAALRLWVEKHNIEQKMHHIDGHIHDLSLLLLALNLLKVDQVASKVDEINSTLHKIGSALKTPTKVRLQNTDAFPSEDERQALETNQKVRAFATNAVTLVVMDETTSWTRTRTTARAVSPSLAPINNDRIALRREQLDCEWDANREALKRLMDNDLFENAVEIQRRAMEVREQLAPSREAWLLSDERHFMEEQLADILLKWNTEESRDTALSILQRLVTWSSTEQRGSTHTDPSFPVSESSRSPRKDLGLRYKLGRLYIDTGQLEAALVNLNIVFSAYSDEQPKDLDKIREVGTHLEDIYSLLTKRGAPRQRAVSLTQLKGFRIEFERTIGKPPTRRLECPEALKWCEAEGIPVVESNKEFRFHIMDEEGASSPLHRAAERCHDEIVLQQMIENSDTLENRNQDEETPLLVAIGSSNMGAIKLLLGHGASVRARDKERQTPLHRSQQPAVTRLLLGDRVRRNSTATELSACTEFSFADEDLEINAQDVYKRTALYAACHSGQERIVELLLLARADPKIPQYTKSPLAAAIESKAERYSNGQGRKRRVKIITALVRAGADAEEGKGLLQSYQGPEKNPLMKALENSDGNLSLLSSSMKSFDLGKSSSGGSSGDQSSLSSASTRTGSVPKHQLEPIGLDSSSFPDFSKPDN